ncbi:MAG: phosphotransferase [Pseudomonadota bacterium]
MNRRPTIEGASGRAACIDAFLAAEGFAGATHAPLAGDASNRRYRRVNWRGKTWVLMDAPPATNERMDTFVEVTRWLRRQGLSAPEVVAAQLDGGLLLLEDLGDALFARAIPQGRATEEGLYAAAVDLLADLASVPDAPEGIGPYDGAVLYREARLVTDWYAPGAGAPLGPVALAEFDAALDEAMAPLAGARAVTVLRDYHAENLLWLPGRAGHARVGLLDYQDALLGHRAYDLVSLLEDARRDTPPALQQAMLQRYLKRRGIAGEDAAAFRTAYDALGAQRNLKIVGIFARLALRDGKPRYLTMIPRVWAHLQRDLTSPDLAPLAGAVARHLPAPTSKVLARMAERSGAGAA